MRRTLKAGAALAAIGFALATQSTALGSEVPPQWTITGVSRPTNFAPGSEEDAYKISVTNTGGHPTDGSPVVISEELPTGLSLDPAGASGEAEASHEQKLTCVGTSCTYTGVVAVDQTLVVSFPVDVSKSAPPSVTDVARVGGGGATDMSTEIPTQVSEAPADFGISPGSTATTLSTVQAGAHADLTAALAFNTVNAFGSLAGDPKDVHYDLPPGFAGDLIDTPSCPAATFRVIACAPATQVGVVSVSYLLHLTTAFTAIQEIVPVYNLTPDPGEVAKLGFNVSGEAGAFVEGGVYLRGDYGLETVFENAPQNLAELNSVSLTLWGVPADPVHDALRFEGVGGAKTTFGHPSQAALAPFFTNPTACEGVRQASFSATSWQAPDTPLPPADMTFGPIEGCDRLGMEPSLTAEPTTTRAYAPSGLDLGLNVPQTNANAEGLATSTLKDAVVTLPEGMTVNPSAGAGLGACSEGQYAEEAAQASDAGGCPNESKLGEVSIVTPAIKEAINGSVYIATPAPNGESGRNPFNSLIVLYIVARVPERGIIIKAAGLVTANPLTGQLTTTFSGLPPLPFSTFTFRFHSGATAPLVTPPMCGSYDVAAQLTPYADPSETIAPTIPAFSISSAFGGGPCPAGASSFSPQVSAGTLDSRAGSYSPVDVRITREDGEQEITGFSSQLPAGLTANLTGVPFCSESDIALARAKTGAQEEAAPSCPLASRIGHTLVGAGVGSTLVYAPGELYMGGAFEGAPFSIVAITTAKVGPFDLGTVVVRLPLDINRETGAVSVGAGGADQIPHIIKGIVVHVRDIRVYVDRPDFTVNPTNCEPLQFAATVVGSGASFTDPSDDTAAPISDHFEASNCRSLQFKPSFTATTSSKTSRANGASLNVKLRYPNAPQGTQTDIRYVKVSLPVQLPSRLSTLQKACRDGVFNRNPAECPALSVVGHATVRTPILPVPLTGPAYFVSHGNAKFPDLVIVLQGYGVTIQLRGETQIKHGVTSSTFHAVPDEPFSSFELTLPAGHDSALAAFGNLCAPTRTVKARKTVAVRVHGRVRHVVRVVQRKVATALEMPTIFIAQNNASIHQNTPIKVDGCKRRPKPQKAR